MDALSDLGWRLSRFVLLGLNFGICTRNRLDGCRYLLHVPVSTVTHTQTDGVDHGAYAVGLQGQEHWLMTSSAAVYFRRSLAREIHLFTIKTLFDWIAL